MTVFFYVFMLYLIDKQWNIVINEKHYPRNSLHVTVTGTINDYSVFNQFIGLETIDFSGATISASDYEMVASQMEEPVEIFWNVPVGDLRVPNTSESLSISPETNIRDASAIHYFPNLKNVYVFGFTASPLLLDIFNAAKSVNPDVNFQCSTSIYGVEVDETTEFLDLNSIKIKDLTELDIALTLFPNIKTVEMCSCRLPNEELAALRAKYPDKKIVWLLIITNHLSRRDANHFSFSIRTDAQVFSTLGKMKHEDFTSEVAQQIFRYCTELRALDLRHNNITDLSGIENLKHLHTLILADNAITDVSPLADCKMLNYVEIQYNHIKDATPFGELPLLEDLYLVKNADKNSRVHNIIAVSKCEHIKRIDIAESGIPSAEVRELVKATPDDCWIKDTWVACNLQHWQRTLKNYYIKEAFSNWQKVKEFSDWQHTVYREEDVYAKYK